MNGILLIDKPSDMTSFGVVARVRRILSQEAGKKVKVGHTGTLDPFATGLMILVIGPACRQAESFSKLDKVYEATITLGESSTTGDPEGDVSHVSDIIPTELDIRTTLTHFTGQIEQTPPIYSAIKIDGQRAYKLARNGAVVEMPKRLITIHSLELIEYSYPHVKIRTHVSSGTYIRSLAQDIGAKLGTGAYTTQLRRLKTAEMSVNSAVHWEDVSSNQIIALP